MRLLQTQPSIQTQKQADEELKFTCTDKKPKAKYVIFDEDVWLCTEHYSQLQKEVFS